MALDLHPDARCSAQSVGKNTCIGPMAIVASGVILGQDCRIGEHVSIRERTEIGNHVVLASGSRVGPDVRIGDRVSVGSNVVIGDSTLRASAGKLISSASNGAVRSDHAPPRSLPSPPRYVYDQNCRLTVVAGSATRK